MVFFWAWTIVGTFYYIFHITSHFKKNKDIPVSKMFLAIPMIIFFPLFLISDIVRQFE